MSPLFNPIRRVFSNPSLVALMVFSFTLGLLFYFLGRWLLPFVISVIIAYFLDEIIQKFERIGVRRMPALVFVFILFATAIAYLLMVVLPMIVNQAKNLVRVLPHYLSIGHDKLMILPEKFPSFFNQEAIDGLILAISSNLTSYSQEFVAGNRIFASVIALTTAVVLGVLIPVMVFFLLKDKKQILAWLSHFMPSNRQIIYDVWREIDRQIGNYIRGKIVEILVIWALSFICFALFGLQYSLLLSLMVGLSVLIPFVGATLVTIPVLVVAYMQFGLSSHFYWLTVCYFLLQIIDGNVIVPLIFSEAVSIHPVAIIVAVLVFGGIWGFWGVFFAIPLATVVKALLEAWWRYKDRAHHELEEEHLL